MFDGDIDSTFIAVADGSRVSGVVVMEDCVLRNCRFHNIALIGTKEQVEVWKRGFAK